MQGHPSRISTIVATVAAHRPVQDQIMGIRNINMLFELFKGTVFPNQSIIFTFWQMKRFSAFFTEGTNQALGKDAQYGV